MTLLENWRNLAYGDGLRMIKERGTLVLDILRLRKGIYEQILQTRLRVVERYR